MLRKAAVSVALALSLYSPPARAWDNAPWTARDTAAEATLGALALADVLQTRAFLDNCPTCHEVDPLMGSHPSPARLYGSAVVAVGAHALVARLLPRTWRTVWQAAVIGLEAANVGRNVVAQPYAGVHLKF